MAKARLEEQYRKTIRSQLQKDLALKNEMQVPRLSKIVLNVGVKDAVADSKVLNVVSDTLAKIAGQAPVRTLAKKSIASFKIREGMPLGVMVTLRGKRMYEFLDRLITLALPKVKDFQGVTSKLDHQGNYNLGIKEWTIFPEADDVHGKVYGLNITICTTSDEDAHAHALLNAFGMPFKKK
jgi:large subunit ribosomal protein L5